MANNNAKLSLDELAQQYGYAASFFATSPELENLIQQATAQQWSVAMFQAKFMATNWYRSYAASARQWIELGARDPATQAQEMTQRIAKLNQMASQEGVTIDPTRMNELANASLMFNFNDQQLGDMIGAELKYVPGQTQGLAATNEEQIRKAANDYGITLSDDTVGQWDQQMLRGSYTLDNINSLVKNMAMSKYPGLSQYLNEGFTVKDVADPYIQSYAQILETPASTVQLSDPLIQKALQGIQQPSGGSKTGQGSTGTPLQPQSLYDFENTLKQDPRWLNTKNAHDSLNQAGMSILRDWGLYS